MTDFIEQIKSELGEDWIPTIYGEEIRALKTRAFDLNFPSKENDVEILHTLIGIQMKSGKRLIGCPDLSAARYLRVFARIGCGIVAIPYDITLISGFADRLESSWQKTLLLLKAEIKELTPQLGGRKRAALVRLMRNELVEIGPGEMMPDFDTETRQRRR